MGGYTEALRRAVDIQDKCSWFTVFRHPVSRVVSAFFYCKFRPLDYLCASMRMPPEAHNDVTEFARHWGNFGLRQFAMSTVAHGDVIDYIEAEDGGNMTKIGRGEESVGWYNTSGWYLMKMYLNRKTKAGQQVVSDQDPDGAMRHMLKPVQNLLCKRYAAVGILEKFDATLSLFNAALAIPGMDWKQEFSARGIRNQEKTLLQEEKETLAAAWTDPELKRYISLDLLLYEHAVDVFHEQAKLHGLK